LQVSVLLLASRPAETLHVFALTELSAAIEQDRFETC